MQTFNGQYTQASFSVQLFVISDRQLLKKKTKIVARFQTTLYPKGLIVNGANTRLPAGIQEFLLCTL